MPNLLDFLTLCGDRYEGVGVNHPRLGQLPENCFVISETPLIPGCLHSSTPSLTVITWEEDLTLPLTMSGVRRRVGDGCSDEYFVCPRGRYVVPLCCPYLPEQVALLPCPTCITSLFVLSRR